MVWLFEGMPRKIRIQYAGAVYHVMSRGDRREPIFVDTRDHELFLETLREMCQRTGMIVHAYVLMPNHYHLLLETPHAHLITGMKWLQGTYTQRFNGRHKLVGHLFQGRYKALLIDPEEASHFRMVSDYIHLNPIRAGLLDKTNQCLLTYPWSSYPYYIGSRRDQAAWLKVERVLASVTRTDDTVKSRRRYQRYMEKRTKPWINNQPDPDLQREWDSIRRGWYMGDEEFRDRLYELAGKAICGKKRASFAQDGLSAHDEQCAERLLNRGLVVLGLHLENLLAMRKNDKRKQCLVWFVKSHTTVSDEWLCRRLEMGDRSNVSRAVKAFRNQETPEIKSLCQIMHVCTD